LSWEQGFAKTVTNNLPILSVLGLGLILKLSRYEIILFVCPLSRHIGGLGWMALLQPLAAFGLLLETERTANEPDSAGKGSIVYISISLS
jgi:hypothetical protein